MLFLAKIKINIFLGIYQDILRMKKNPLNKPIINKEISDMKNIGIFLFSMVKLIVLGGGDNLSLLIPDGGGDNHTLNSLSGGGDN